MKAVTSLLILLLFLAFIAAAQPMLKAPRHIITGSDFPDCTIGTVFFNTAAPIGKNYFLCTSALIWTEKNPKDLGIFDVKLFGAHGDGRTDDQAMIQTASENASGTNSAIVFFPPGTYRHSGVLDFATGTVLHGCGQESILLAGNSAAGAIRFSDAGLCGIEQLKISSPARQRLQNDESAGLLFKNSHDCYATNIWIDGAGSAGINIHGSHDMRIDHVDVRNTQADGIHVVSGSRRVVVSNNTATATGDDSFSAVAYASQEQTDSITFDQNVSVGSKARGVTCIGASNCVITNNQIFGPSAHGIAVAFEDSYHTYYPSKAVVQGNLIRDVLRPGMNPLLVDQATDVTIGANSIYESLPVYVHGGSKITVRALQVFQATGAALIGSNSSQLVIANMQVTGSQDTAIVLSSISGGQVTDNHLIDPQLRGDATLAAIEIHDSRDLSGTGNTVEHTNSWKGRSWGPIRSVNSWQVTVTAQMVQ